MNSSRTGGANWKVVGLGRHAHPQTPFPKLGRRLGGEPLRVGAKRLQSRPSPTVAAKVPWSIFLLMVLLTVVERGCLPHITSFPFSLISCPAVSMALSSAQPLSTCIVDCDPTLSIGIRFLGHGHHNIHATWLLGQGHNPCCFHLDYRRSGILLSCWI